MSLSVLLKNATNLRGRYDRIARITFRGKRSSIEFLFMPFSNSSLRCFSITPMAKALLT